MVDSTDDFLEHYGVKGMHWGVRNEYQPHPRRRHGSQSGRQNGFRLQTIHPTMADGLDPTTVSAANQVADLMSTRYGFRINEVKNLNADRPDEVARGTAAFVANTPGKSGGIIYIKTGNLNKEFDGPPGWMAPGTMNTRGLLTHESAHALFHAQSKRKTSFWTGQTTVTGGFQAARDKAFSAAGEQAQKDGISPYQFLSHISKYAEYSGNREEAEAEMFAQYHWGTNPPNFIKVWGQTLHQEMGIDPTPFKEVVKNG